MKENNAMYNDFEFVTVLSNAKRIIILIIEERR